MSLSSSSPFKINNTLSGYKEELIPIQAGHIRMYVCGPTVYDDPHIGHLRSAFIFDFIRRFLSINHKVTFVRNVTDIDDKIIARANEEGIPTQEISTKYLKAYHQALDQMGIIKPSHEPCATSEESLKAMRELIQRLIDRGLAYDASGNVYYRVNKFESYGALSRQNLDQVLEETRVEAGEGKENPLDFALWKKSSDQEPSWDSPWGPGRPGWHIECSAMSGVYCGEEFDIHGGGRDLLFPHHENERAQSMGATQKSFAKYWIHHGLITTDSKKMSKSLGNFITLNQVTNKYPVDALVLFFLQSHYSQDADFTWKKMEANFEALKSFYLFFEKVKEALSDDQKDKLDESLEESSNGFMKEIQDDFNTPKALAYLFNVLRLGNQALHDKDVARLSRCYYWIKKYAGLLGLFKLDFSQRKSTNESSVLSDLIQLRDEKRKSKRFDISDYIRDSLALLGYVIEDGQSRSQVTSLDSCNKQVLDEDLIAILKKAKEM